MIIQILSQQSLYSRILDAGNDFSSRQCFHVEGFGKIPIFHPLTPELPLGSAVDVGAKGNWEILEPWTKGEYFGKTSFFKLNSLPNIIPALEPPWPPLLALLGPSGFSSSRFVRGNGIVLAPHWKTSWISFFSLFLTGIPAPGLGTYSLCWHSPDLPHEVMPGGFFMDTSPGSLPGSLQRLRGKGDVGFLVWIRKSCGKGTRTIPVLHLHGNRESTGGPWRQTGFQQEQRWDGSGAALCGQHRGENNVGK